MKNTVAQQPSPEQASPMMPQWMPAQFKDESELHPSVRRRRERKRARLRDDYAGREFTLGEIIANSVSQGVAAALSLVALVILVVRALANGGGIHLVAALIFAVPMLVAFVMSTLYHALQVESAKRVFKVLDSSSTYLLIVGAFAPYCLITLADANGLYVLLFELAVAIAGIIVESVWATRPRWIHGVLYGIMSLAFLVSVPTLYALLPAAGFWLLAAAVIALAASLVFRLFSSVPYLRFVFHVVAAAGMVCLFLSVALFVV